MAIRKHTAEGWTEATAITAAAGSGSGDQLAAVITTGGTFTARAAAAVDGAMGIRATATSAAAVGGSLTNQTGTSAAAMPGSIRVRVPAAGYPQQATVLRGMDTAEAAQRYRVLVNTAGRVVMGAANYNGATGTVLGTSAGTYNGKAIRIRCIAQGSTSATWSLAIFDLAAGPITPAETLSGAGANLGGPIQRTRGWIAAASGAGITVDADSLAVSDDGTDPDPTTIGSATAAARSVPGAADTTRAAATSSAGQRTAPIMSGR